MGSTSLVCFSHVRGRALRRYSRVHVAAPGLVPDEQILPIGTQARTRISCPWHLPDRLFQAIGSSVAVPLILEERQKGLQTMSTPLPPPKTKVKRKVKRKVVLKKVDMDGRMGSEKVRRVDAGKMHPLRHMRLAAIRSKMKEPASVAFRSETSDSSATDHRSIELRCISESSNRNWRHPEADPDILGTGGNDRATRGKCHLNLGRKQTLCIFSIHILLLVLIGVFWMLTLARKRDDIIAMECARTEVFPPAAYLCFLGFLFTATCFRPTNRVASSLRNRKIFSMVNLVLVCTAAISAAAIGYPQGLCPANCVCGACSHSVNLSQSNEHRVETEKAACSRIETNNSSDFASRAPCSGRGTDLPTVCSLPVAPIGFVQGGSAEISGYLSSSGDASDLDGYSIDAIVQLGLKELFDSFGSTDFDNWGGGEKDLPCELKLHIENCTYFAEQSIALNFAQTAVSATCDSMYAFCDRQKMLRRPCPTNTCCSICNTIAQIIRCQQQTKYSDTFKHVLKSLKIILNDDTRKHTWGSLGRLEEVYTLLIEAHLSLLNASNSSQILCMDMCQIYHSDRTSWYGSSPECLPKINRSWFIPSSRSNFSNVSAEQGHETVKQGRSKSCKCDQQAEEWTSSVLGLHTCLFGGVILTLVCQTLVAIAVDKESSLILLVITQSLAKPPRRKERCTFLFQTFRMKEHLLAVIVSSLLVLGFVLELNDIVTASKGIHCYSGEGFSMRGSLTDKHALENVYIMRSWATLNVTVCMILMANIYVCGVQWFLRRDFANDEASTEINTSAKTQHVGHHAAQEFHGKQFFRAFSSKLQRCREIYQDVSQGYNDMFSLEKGQFYLHIRLASEIIEVVNQSIQLLSLSTERPIRWILAVSITLSLNGVSMLALICCRRDTKLSLVATDIVFDIAYLLIAVEFSDRYAFSKDTWWVATASIVVPSVGISMIVQDLVDYARNNILTKEWASLFGMERPRRRSLVLVHFKDNTNTARKCDGLPPILHRFSVARCLSILVSISAAFSGCFFVGLALKGDMKCREMLGDALWEGATPQFVVIRSNKGILKIHGDCNLSAIESIESHRTSNYGGPAIERLPNEMSRLSRLKRLHLSGHRITSNGVPATILDAGVLPFLKELNFGEDSPANRVLDLSKTGAYLDTFPSHLLQFMTNLEQLHLGDTNVSCFPPYEQISRLKRLHSLNLTGTKVSYVPPSILFRPSSWLQNIDLSNTPVSIALDWGGHGLGFLDWNRLVTTLPLLRSLNLSRNDLFDAEDLGIDLMRLPYLERLDVSHNPQLTPLTVRDSNFSWWDSLTEHPVLGAPEMERYDVNIKLVNVGLNVNHFALLDDKLMGVNTAPNFALSCRHLRWMRAVISALRLDVSENDGLMRFVSWRLKLQDRGRMRCKCLHPQSCVNVDEGIFYILSAIAQNARYIAASNIFLQGSCLHSKTLTFTRLMQTIAKAEKLRSIEFDRVLLCGHLPSQIGQLKALIVLKIENSGLEGEIPHQISLLTNLASLELNGNKLRGRIPGQLRELRGLKEFACLRNPNISGRIPDEITQCSSLMKLELDSTSLTGSIPSGIGALSQLTKLVFFSTKKIGSLSGRIPASVSRLTRLQQVTLNYNKFSGPIPDGIGNLVSLRHLNLGANSLTGAIPTSITAFRALEYLELYNNQLDGPIPSRIGNIMSLRYLNLHSNHLIGPVPRNLFALTNLKGLWLGGNHLSGEIHADIANLTKLLDLTLEPNDFEKPYPPLPVRI